MKTLSQILNSVSIVEDANLTEGTAWKILNTTLRNLGFEAATGNDLRGFKGVPKEDILNLYGIPMRAGKWADVWFAILEDDVYIIVNGNHTYEYGHMGDAIKAIQKIGVQQKKNAVNEARDLEDLQQDLKDFVTIYGMSKINAEKSLKADYAKLQAQIAAAKKNESLEEKLSADDDASVWISDFVRSTDPRFEGKSKKERIKMALGAYYAAQNEEVEEVEEKLSTVNEDRSFETFDDKHLKMWLKINWTTARVGDQFAKELKAAAAEAKKRGLKWMKEESVYENLEESFTAATASKITGAQIEKYLDSQNFKAIEQICKFMTKDELETWAANGYEGRTYELLMKSRQKNEEIQIDDEQLNEEVDYYKFKQLAILGLLSPGDANKAALGMKAIEGGHPPTQEQKRIIGDTLVLLVDMITGDSAVLNKLKKTARDAKNAPAKTV